VLPFESEVVYKAAQRCMPLLRVIASSETRNTAVTSSDMSLLGNPDLIGFPSFSQFLPMYARHPIRNRILYLPQASRCNHIGQCSDEAVSFFIAVHC
jgi:hypothetical protein